MKLSLKQSQAYSPREKELWINVVGIYICLHSKNREESLAPPAKIVKKADSIATKLIRDLNEDRVSTWPIR